MMRHFHALLCAICATAVLLGGCGGGGKEYKFYPVKGKVLRGDAPLTGGTVNFTSPEDNNYVASSQIGADGTFDLKTSTTNPPRTDVPGAPEGKYDVIVRMPQEGKSPPPSLRAPETYTVKAGDNDITVKLPAP